MAGEERKERGRAGEQMNQRGRKEGRKEGYEVAQTDGTKLREMGACLPACAVRACARCAAVRPHISQRYEKEKLCIGKLLFVSCEIYEARVKAAETAPEGKERNVSLSRSLGAQG